MEAPEKIYIPTILVANVVRYKEEGSIEYVRTDAFIEKALKWYCLDCECNDNCNADHKCFFRQEYKRYLEGNAILPDEDAAKNYRYRHFILKRQDAFIEKACEYLSKHQCEYIDFDDFRKAMKGK